MLFKSNNIFSTEKIGLVSELNVTFQRIFHVKIKLSELYAQYLFFCSIRICLDSVFVKISEIRPFGDRRRRSRNRNLVKIMKIVKHPEC